MFNVKICIPITINNVQKPLDVTFSYRLEVRQSERRYVQICDGSCKENVQESWFHGSKKKKTSKTEVSKASKSMLGGSIQPNKLKIKDIEPRAPELDEENPKTNWMQVLQRLAASESAPSHGMKMSQMRDDLSNYQWLNDIAYFQHDVWFQKHPEDVLYKGALPLFSGKGAAGDNPETHKFFMDSFSEHPELIQAYTRGTVKHKPDISNKWKSFVTQPHLFIPHSQIK